LIELSQQGDRNAFGEIVERYQSLVCSVAYNRCGDLAWSEDLAQEAFLLAWQKLGQLREVASFKAWLCTIVRNLAGREAKRRGTTTEIELDVVSEFPSDAVSPVERAASAEEETLVWQALSDVPENYREPLILFYREDQSVARVAEALDLSEDAVKQRLSRGRKMLREQLAATVASVLAGSKPAKSFTAAVLAGIAASKANAAAAAGVTAAVTKAATANVSSGMGGLLLGPILQLPIVAWMLKTSFDETRSNSERDLLVRHFVRMSFAFVVFLVATFSFALTTWWHEYVESPVLRGLVIPAMMIPFCIYNVFASRRLGKQIERLRLVEETGTPPRPLTPTEAGRPRVYLLFVLSALLIVIWPMVLPYWAGDWSSLLAMLLIAVGGGAIAGWLSIRVPNRAFQCYGVGLAIIALIVLGLVTWRRVDWAPAFENELLWFFGALHGLAMSLGILSMLAWKRVYGKNNN
jgi:RNA polymerase sigma factor (sigma-70 family)